MTAAALNQIRATLRTTFNTALRRGLTSGSPAARVSCHLPGVRVR